MSECDVVGLMGRGGHGWRRMRHARMDWGGCLEV